MRSDENGKEPRERNCISKITTAVASFQTLSEVKRQERIGRDFIIVAWAEPADPAIMN